MIVASAKPRSGLLATVLSAALLLFTASGVFVETRDSLNALWGFNPKYHSGIWSAVRERLLSLGMVFAIGSLLLSRRSSPRSSPR
jgi:membrane protein